MLRRRKFYETQRVYSHSVPDPALDEIRHLLPPGVIGMKSVYKDIVVEIPREKALIELIEELLQSDIDISNQEKLDIITKLVNE